MSISYFQLEALLKNLPSTAYPEAWHYLSALAAGEPAQTPVHRVTPSAERSMQSHVAQARPGHGRRRLDDGSDFDAALDGPLTRGSNTQGSGDSSDDDGGPGGTENTPPKGSGSGTST